MQVFGTTAGHVATGVSACDDFPCCQGGTAGTCHGGRIRWSLCRGHVQKNRPDVQTVPNGRPKHPVRTCRNCRTHDFNAGHPQWQPGTRIGVLSTTNDRNALNPDPAAFQYRLCGNCIRNELQLYEERCANPALLPAPLDPQNDDPQQHGTERYVVSWPAAVGQPQDLCICDQWAVQCWIEQCHACRDQAWTNQILDFDDTVDMLRNAGRGSIAGTNRGGRIIRKTRTQDKIEKTGDMGRCPCGSEPTRRTQNQLDYATICAACMGVRIVPANLPKKFRDIRHRPHKQGVKFGHLPNANRRVNIERAWLADDKWQTL
jgi:hypothetical protein